MARPLKPRWRIKFLDFSDVSVTLSQLGVSGLGLSIDLGDYCTGASWAHRGAHFLEGNCFVFCGNDNGAFWRLAVRAVKIIGSPGRHR